ncbi:squalene epoxidase-domain-containing protein [Zychaea mexicana]|uniref:squalene epoxidase-domain-containing protein n=1 Tax=Zychaea mexicana TaxID=64656 RepID=UPI0022FEE85F|nr:squalene epoxidase-domain-containing protein [Zychaea mexicana]KAI9497955.1 squalene epoxidase-domain-containing protein [Zychaea mexicana]
MPAAIHSIEEYDIIIVGAGVVGTAAAKAFGSSGRRVLLLERDLSEPDRIVGELLQPGGVNSLIELGLEDCIEDIDGIPCYGYGVFRNEEVVHIPYPTDEGTGKQAMGKSFHHGKFIQKLRAAATNTKNHFAPLTIVCDGLFSRFRKEFTEKTPDVRSHFVGFEIKDLTLPMPNHGHVILAKPAPVLMYQIGTHETRVLVDVPGQLPSVSTGELKKYMQEVVAPGIPESLREKFIGALETERLRSMPNSFLPPSSNQSCGLIVLGDAMNMRHPLTGGGMTVALNDVVLLKDYLSPESIPSLTEADVVVQQMDAFHWARKRYCTAINVLAMALYRLFAAEDENLAVLQRGCFEYFKLGGACVDGPVGLLSGLIQRPFVLVYHFFAVAFYAIFCEFKRGGWSQAPLNILRIFTVLYAACVTIMPYLWSETKS